jgi:GT2 family glycosyltransferase
MAPRLFVSVVVYRTPPAVLTATLDSLALAASQAWRQGQVAEVQLALVDNQVDSDSREDLWALLSRPVCRVFPRVALYSGQGNVGYGMGHNRVMMRSSGDYHLVLNPDVLLAPMALVEALHFLEAHPEVGLLAPRVDDQNGHRQYLCKRYPSVLGLLLRGFAPTSVQQWFASLLHRYEMRDLLDCDRVVWDFPIASGCFMLFRTRVVHTVGGFSSRFFMYFEDFDLSLRMRRASRTVYVPAVRIVHFGGRASRKGWRHIGWFGHSMFRFFNRHGWRWY